MFWREIGEQSITLGEARAHIQILVGAQASEEIDDVRLTSATAERLFCYIISLGPQVAEEEGAPELSRGRG